MTSNRVCIRYKTVNLPYFEKNNKQVDEIVIQTCNKIE